MPAPVIVPRCNEEWRPDSPFRVEHLLYAAGFRGFVYFDDVSDAAAFASERTLRGQPCVIESKVMTTTHTVSKFAITDPLYLFWSKHFGNLESATAEYDRGCEHVRENGGGIRICEASGKQLNEFSNYKD
jgi:hypothetical protein